MRCLKVFIPNILAELFQSEGTRGGAVNPHPSNFIRWDWQNIYSPCPDIQFASHVIAIHNSHWVVKLIFVFNMVFIDFNEQLYQGIAIALTNTLFIDLIKQKIFGISFIKFPHISSVIFWNIGFKKRMIYFKIR